MKLYFDFQLGAGWEEVTAYTSDHWYLTKRAASSNYHHAVNLLNATLRYNAALFTLIKNSTVDILVQMREDDETPMFTGYFKPTTDGVYNGIVNLQSIQIEAQDYTEYTNTAVGEPGVAYKNYKIMDPANPTTSIVHALFTKIGLSTSLIDASLIISTVVGAFTSDTESDTCLELLDTLLHEYGYVFSWSDSGLFHPIPWIPSGSASYAFTDSNIQGEIHTSASIKEYEGAEVTWYGLDTKLGTRIYTEDLPFDADGDFSGYTVLPSGIYYYPPEANVIDETTGQLQKVYQEYTDDGVRYKSSKYVQDAYEMNFALAHADFSEILITENHVIEDHYDTGIVRDISLFYNQKAQIRYTNPTAGGLLLYYMNISADVTYKRSKQKCQVQLVVGSTKLMEYKSRFIFDKATADVLAQALANDTLYGRTTWEFMGSEEVAAGSFVSLSLGDGTTASGFLLESKYDGYYEQYSYTVRGISYSFSPITKRLVVENASSQQQQSEQQALKPTAPSVTVAGDSQFVYQGSFAVPNPSSVTLSLNVDGTIPASYQWYSRNISGVDVEIPRATSDTLNIPYAADYLLPTDTIITCLVNDKWHGAYSITKKQIDEYRLQITGGTANISYDQFGLNPAPSADQEWTADFYKNDVLQSTGVTYAWSCGGNLAADGVTNAKTFNTAIDAAISAGETFVQCSGIYGGKALSTRQVIPISHYDATLDWAEQWDATKESMYTGDILIGDRVVTGRIYAGTLEDDPVHTGYKRLKTGFAIGNKIQIKGASTTEERDGFVVVKDGVIVAFMDVLGNATWNGTVTASGVNSAIATISDELTIGEDGWQAGGISTPDLGDTRTFMNAKKFSVQKYDGNLWIDQISMGKQTLLSGVQFDMDIGGRSLSYDEKGNKVGMEVAYSASDVVEVKEGSLHLNTAARDWWVDGQTIVEYAEAQPAGNVDKGWMTSCSSSDGVVLLAGVGPADGGRLYLSTNSGTSWTEVQPAGNVDKSWQTSSISSDGTKIIVGCQNITGSGGRLYLSTNSGTSWTEVQPAGNVDKDWKTSAMSADGTEIVAAVSSGAMYLSSNMGSTWTEIPYRTTSNWLSVAMSADGIKIVASCTAAVCLSLDSGITWADVTIPGTASYYGLFVSMSADGTRILTGILNGRLYLSLNSGSTWTEVRPAGDVDKNWRAGAMSANGTRIIVNVPGGRLYLSLDSGTSWSILSPIGDIDGGGYTVSISANGNKILTSYYNRLYFISKYRSLITSSTPNFPSAGQWKYVCVDINGNISLENATGTAAQRPTDDCYSQTALVTGFNAVGKHGYYFSDSKRIIGAIHKVSSTSWYFINNLNGREEIGETSTGKYYIDAMGDSFAADVDYVTPEFGGVLPIGGMLSWPSETPPSANYKLVGSQPLSRTAYPDLYDMYNIDKGACTVSITASGLFTLNAHGLVTGDCVELTTTGALPTGYLANVNYFVVYTDDNTFRLAASSMQAAAGTTIVATGTQSGTHSLRKCTWGIDGASSFSLPYKNDGFMWSELRPAGDANGNWYTSSMSANGVYILMSSLTVGRLYLSINSGTTWAETQPAGATTKQWHVAAMSSDGTKMLAGVNGGRLYLSTNSGTSWTEVQPAGNVDKFWRSAALSSDGSKILVGAYNGRLYLSVNTGSSWTEVQPAGNVDAYWFTLSMSSDGVTLLAGISGGRMYLSVNSGTSWAETQPAGSANKDWAVSCMSANGVKMLAGISGGRIYLSTNTGTSWAEIQPAGDVNRYWRGAAMSADGNALVVSSYTISAYKGVIYLSKNKGATWLNISPLCCIAEPWLGALNMTSDGNKIVAGSYPGRAYMTTIPKLQHNIIRVL